MVETDVDNPLNQKMIIVAHSSFPLQSAIRFNASKIPRKVGSPSPANMGYSYNHRPLINSVRSPLPAIRSRSIPLAYIQSPYLLLLVFFDL